MKVETWSCPWMSNEISIDVIRNMILLRNFVICHWNINLLISIATYFFGINKMLKHGIQFGTITKTWYLCWKSVKLFEFRTLKDNSIYWNMFYMNWYGLLFNWTLQIGLILCKCFIIVNWILSKLKETLLLHIQIEKVWSNTIVLPLLLSDRFWQNMTFDYPL